MYDFIDTHREPKETEYLNSVSLSVCLFVRLFTMASVHYLTETLTLCCVLNIEILSLVYLEIKIFKNISRIWKYTFHVNVKLDKMQSSALQLLN